MSVVKERASDSLPHASFWIHSRIVPRPGSLFTQCFRYNMFRCIFHLYKIMCLFDVQGSIANHSVRLFERKLNNVYYIVCVDHSTLPLCWTESFLSSLSLRCFSCCSSVQTPQMRGFLSSGHFIIPKIPIYFLSGGTP